MSTPAVAVIGAGASGALAAAHLLRAADGPSRLVLVERSGVFGPGIAYATTDSRHLLNTPAGKMSAIETDREHFVRWARREGMDVDAASFVPRREYGRYLTATLLDEEHSSLASTERITGEVSRVVPDGDAVVLWLAGGQRLRVDVVVLATGAGNGDPVGHLVAGETNRYIADPWAEGALSAVGDGDEVLVLGTGLTMMDLALSLTGGTRTTVHAVSRHGLLPHPHRAASGGAVAEVPERAGTVGELLRYARRAVSADPDRWRAFVDHIRPHTAALWQQLDVEERRRFLSRINRFWDVHRHRAAPETHRKVRILSEEDRLRLHRGRVTAVRSTGSGLDVELTTRGRRRVLAVDWLVNATGFPLVLAERTDPLVRGLLAEGVARPDELGLGVGTAANGNLLAPDGQPQRVFALGALRRGELFESTAVPEIRAQAATIASTIHELGRDPVRASTTGGEP
ncbi:MAG: hypothetical protein QOI21_2706 [Actinomycetota bacterium]|nr:hypothetical protein [Actinomycetota bacterium]